MDIDGGTIRRLVSAGWTPPKQDYEAWRECLAIYYAGRDLPGSAERVRENRTLLADDRATIDALALAFEAAPRVDHVG